MQKEIEAEKWSTMVQIHGVNGAGLESGNAATCQGRTIPWLQDTASAQVYQEWKVTYRDVIIVNQRNEAVAAYNLTSHNLAIQETYDELKALLRQTAE